MMSVFLVTFLKLVNDAFHKLTFFNEKSYDSCPENVTIWGISNFIGDIAQSINHNVNLIKGHAPCVLFYKF